MKKRTPGQKLVNRGGNKKRPKPNKPAAAAKGGKNSKGSKKRR